MLQAQARVNERLTKMSPPLRRISRKLCKLLRRQGVQLRDQADQRFFDRVIGRGQFEPAVKHLEMFTELVPKRLHRACAAVVTSRIAHADVPQRTMMA